MKGNKRKVSVIKGSPRVTIPPALAAQIGIEAGTIVRWIVSGRQLILEPVGYEAPKRKVQDGG